jgi:chromosome segregation ATPase
MSILSSDYFSPTAWFNYFFQPSVVRGLEDEEPLHLDFENEVIQLPGKPAQKFPELSSEDQKAHMLGVIKLQEQAVARLQSEKNNLQSQIREINQELDCFDKQRTMWINKRNALPKVIKEKAPQHVFITKKLRELDEKTRFKQMDKTHATTRIHQINTQIQKRLSAIRVIQSKIASTQ